MTTIDLPETVRYITDSEGRRTGVLLDIQAWDSLVEWIENATDGQLALRALSELRSGTDPGNAGWPSWEEVREDWD